MALFRSEEHVDAWLRIRGFDRGMSVPLRTVWALANAWYADPRSTDWRPRTRDENQRVINGVGLTGDFWELP